jgi:hypothetical protein
MVSRRHGEMCVENHYVQPELFLSCRNLDVRHLIPHASFITMTADIKENHLIQKYTRFIKKRIFQSRIVKK